jgi:hypothetical protein
MNLLSPYYSDPEVKSAIDEILHINAIIFQNLGVNSSKAEIRSARAKEKENLRSVKHLDKEFINFLINASNES